MAQRGLDYGRDERMQDQLILRQTELSRLLGDTVISDVAIIGTDMFFREGAAYGFLFEARNNFMLSSDIGSERSDRLARGGVTEQKLKLAGREVSLISSPDGTVRSYYAQRGDYHFVTSSRALAERFVAIAKGAGIAGGVAGIPPRADDHAAGAQRHRVRLLVGRVFPQHHRAALPGGNDAAAGGGGRHRVGPPGPAGLDRRGTP